MALQEFSQPCSSLHHGIMAPWHPASLLASWHQVGLLASMKARVGMLYNALLTELAHRPVGFNTDLALLNI